MRKTIDTIFENRVSLSKQASKQASKQTIVHKNSKIGGLDI